MGSFIEKAWFVCLYRHVETGNVRQSWFIPVKCPEKCLAFLFRFGVWIVLFCLMDSGWLFFWFVGLLVDICCCRISPCGRPAYSAGPKQVTDLHRACGSSYISGQPAYSAGLKQVNDLNRACGSLPCGCFFCLGYHKKSRRRKSLIRLCIMRLWKESVIFLRIPWQEFREVPLPIPPFSPRLFQDRQEDQVRPYWQCHAAEEDSSPCR